MRTPAIARVKLNGSVGLVVKGITFNELKALIADCRAHGNDSLLECFKMRHKSCRVTDDQFYVITWHKAWNEFTF